jgi:hypothetical protein
MNLETLYPNTTMNNAAKSGLSLQALRVSPLILALACLVGCATSGYKKSDAAALSSKEASAKVQAETRDLQTTMSALNDLSNQPSGDFKSQFLLFSRALDQLTATTRQAGSVVDRLSRQRASYFTAWDKELVAIQDEEIRKTSQARRLEVSNQFDAAKRSFDQSQTGLHSLTAYLQDIRKALRTDLTRHGLEGVKPSVNNANEYTRKLQSELAQAVSDLDTLSSRMSSVQVQEGK